MTKEGIIFGMAISIILSAFFAFGIWTSKMKTLKKMYVQTLVFILIFLFFALGGSAQFKKWNNGYCIEDGTKYIPYSRYRNISYYYCPTCGKEVAK